eukprot:9659666-Karenia_brevis.AAC.1
MGCSTTPKFFNGYLKNAPTDAKLGCDRNDDTQQRFWTTRRINCRIRNHGHYEMGWKENKRLQSINNQPYYNSSLREPPEVQRRLQTQYYGLRTLENKKK